MFIEVTGQKTNIKYLINPAYISCMYDFVHGAEIFTNRVQSGSTVVYQVKESCGEIRERINKLYGVGVKPSIKIQEKDREAGKSR